MRALVRVFVLVGKLQFAWLLFFAFRRPHNGKVQGALNLELSYRSWSCVAWPVNSPWHRFPIKMCHCVLASFTTHVSSMQAPQDGVTQSGKNGSQAGVVTIQETERVRPLYLAFLCLDRSKCSRREIQCSVAY